MIASEDKVPVALKVGTFDRSVSVSVDILMSKGFTNEKGRLRAIRYVGRCMIGRAARSRAIHPANGRVAIVKVPNSHRRRVARLG